MGTKVEKKMWTDVQASDPIGIEKLVKWGILPPEFLSLMKKTKAKKRGYFEIVSIGKSSIELVK